MADGEEKWKTYFAEFTGDRAALMEFMPDGKVETLPGEAQTLRELTKEN